MPAAAWLRCCTAQRVAHLLDPRLPLLEDLRVAALISGVVELSLVQQQLQPKSHHPHAQPQTTARTPPSAIPSSMHSQPYISYPIEPRLHASLHSRHNFPPIVNTPTAHENPQIPASDRLATLLTSLQFMELYVQALHADAAMESQCLPQSNQHSGEKPAVGVDGSGFKGEASAPAMEQGMQCYGAMRTADKGGQSVDYMGLKRAQPLF